MSVQISKDEATELYRALILKWAKKKEQEMKKQAKAKKAPPTVTVVRSQIFKVFFESLYEQWDREKEDRPTSCDVLANTTEEAIEKVHAAFPCEQIHMVSGPDRSYFRYNESNKQQERPKGELIVI